MQEWLQEYFSVSASQADLIEKTILTAVVLVVVLVVRAVVVHAVRQRIDDPQIWYRTRKIATYVAAIVLILALVAVWLRPLGGVVTFLGLVSAGIAIALADVLKNFAGWVYIVTRRPFRLGDRIEVGDVAGDVVDLRLFRFSLMEIGNWVAADQSTGRIVHVPNGQVLVEPTANYTSAFAYVWHEIPVVVTFESDWQQAEQLLLEALRAAAPDVVDAAAAGIREAGVEYRLRFTHLTPTVYVQAVDHGIELTGRVLVGVRERRRVNEFVWRRLLLALADTPEVDLAYPTVRTYVPDAIPIRGDGPFRSGPRDGG